MALISCASSSSVLISLSSTIRHSSPFFFHLPIHSPTKKPSKSFHICRTRTLRPRCFSLQPQKGKQSSTTEEFERLFSNLNQATMKREPGSVTSGIFLVAGTTVISYPFEVQIMHGLKHWIHESEVYTSAIIIRTLRSHLILNRCRNPCYSRSDARSWIPCLCNNMHFLLDVYGLLIAEVNVNTMCELGSGGVSLVSMAMRTVGKIGVQVACWSYLFIHYALLVAYVARSSDILTNSFGIPLWESATIFTSFFGGMCYFGSQRVIGAINGFLVFGILVSFSALVGVASGSLQWNSLLEAHFEAVPQSIPIIALSFVYQNVVPVLCTNLEGNLSKVRTSVVLGTAIPLILFLIWDAVILGTISNIQTSSGTVTDPLEQLRSNNGLVGPIVEVFSFLAIGTSYIGFVLGLSDFISDLLKLPSGRSKPLPYLLTLIPPLVLSLLDPEIFFKALDFAGTYGGDWDVEDDWHMM